MTERLRIAYFVPPSAHFAGIERVVHELATGLAESDPDRLDVHVLYASRYDDELLQDTAYTQHVLGADRLRGLGRALRSGVKAIGVDVLVCPQVEASVVGWAATRGLGLPLFLAHLHGNPRLEEAEGTRRTRLAFTAFRHVVSRRVDAVLAVSPSLARYAAGAVTRHAPVHHVPNPVRDLGPATSQLPDSEGAFRFLSVGRLSRQKGQDILLHALAIARPGLPPVRLTLVGTGPEEASLRQLCTDLGLDDLVTFAGYAPDPAEHFRAADCFVLSSRWEGFGVVLVEALHFGLPLLAADCEFGPADLISDPGVGELVAPDDPKALAAGLRRAVAGGVTRAGQDRRRALAAEYTRAAATARHRAVLDRLVSDARARSPRMAAYLAAARR
jgi:glycosyltransferase involved in cell wall biosynthesis